MREVKDWGKRERGFGEGVGDGAMGGKRRWVVEGRLKDERG